MIDEQDLPADHEAEAARIERIVNVFLPDSHTMDEAQMASVLTALKNMARFVAEYRNDLVLSGVPEIAVDLLTAQFQEAILGRSLHP